MPSFFDLALTDLRAALEAWGEPAYRAKQVWQAVYRDLVASPLAITTLPKPLREKLAATFSFSTLTLAAEVKSSDGQTRKVLFQLGDGRAIEAVLMGYTKRRTACISTQAGCA
ncbi:MAG: 23S rRNA (adenine(2503)-C2)-methyltransferase, partial [Anaerolineales bacterium]|nr:23S rRNA (adenine(2503)-C2)-methyltransferase [Anaerolineales bacterium]